MVEIKIYIEGGGEGQLLDTLFRRGWTELFRAAGLTRMPRIVRGKGRKQTYDLFVTAVENRTRDTIPLLLVDSEDAVAPGDTVWQHLKRRDGWNQPGDAGPDEAFLMVQVMETWFLADRDALRTFFGPGLNENAFAQWPDLEAVPKTKVLQVLEKATAACKKPYDKGRTSFELLALVDPAKVEQRCPHAKELLQKLRSL